MLSLFLVSCATTREKEENTINLLLLSEQPNIQYWEQADLDNLVNGLKSGDISFDFFLQISGVSFLENANKGRLLIRKTREQGCYLFFPTYMYVEPVYCPVLGQVKNIDTVELEHINALIDWANLYRTKQIKLAEERKRLAEEQERARIAQQIKEQESQFANYIAPYKTQCKAFGYTDENLVAKCVQDYVFADMAAKEMANKLEQLRKQQDQIRLNNAIAAMGKGLTDLGNRQNQTTICKFKSFSGAIISGDCKNLTISVGGVTYWRQ
tara:strand:- start:89 stop:892 length:804 start_codon:yes stop_codon:yes gene_type:complete